MNYRHPPKCERHPLYSVGPFGCPMCNLENIDLEEVLIRLKEQQESVQEEIQKLEEAKKVSRETMEKEVNW